MGDDRARKLAAHPRWKWAEGMLSDDTGFRVVSATDNGYVYVDEIQTVRGEPRLGAYAPEQLGRPDLADPATVGCLLDMLGHVRVRRDVTSTVTTDPQGEYERTYSGDTIGEAVALAVLDMMEST